MKRFSIVEIFFIRKHDRRLLTSIRSDKELLCQWGVRGISIPPVIIPGIKSVLSLLSAIVIGKNRLIIVIAN